MKNPYESPKIVMFICFESSDTILNSGNFDPYVNDRIWDGLDTND